MRGFEYLIHSAFSLCLLVVLVLLPLAPVFAFADEIVQENTPEITYSKSILEIVEQTTLPEADSETNTLSPNESNDVVLEQNTVSLEEGLELPIPLESTEKAISVTLNDPDYSIEEVVDVISNGPEEFQSEADATDIETNSEETSESLHTEDAEISIEDSAIENETSEEEIPDEIEIEESLIENFDLDPVATTTGTENTTVVSVQTNDENKFSFAKNECTAAGDGTFYCVKQSSLATVTNTDRIFSALDMEGDKEIYVEKGGVLIPITDNRYDDEAPYYDEISNTAVWQRLIEGRHQIISFDFDTEVETQITDDYFNNMEPKRFDESVVWQGWVGNDWEIFLLNKNEITMITDNIVHDIAPSINGTHIVWQSFEENMWVMKVYDIRTKITATIDDTDGGSIENPRFVLVYDSKQDTGDIETRGYDLESGEVIALGSKPVQLPDELPDPDQTGEKRALVTTTTQLKQKTEDDGEDDTLPNTMGTSTPNDTDLVITPFDDTAATTSSSTLENSQGSSTIDIIVPTLTVEDTYEISHIEDVIVVPFDASTTIMTDTH